MTGRARNARTFHCAYEPRGFTTFLYDGNHASQNAAALTGAPAVKSATKVYWDNRNESIFRWLGVKWDVMDTTAVQICASRFSD